MGDLTLSLPEPFNVATYFIDRHLAHGRADALAVLYEDNRFSYRQVAEQVNRAAQALARAGLGREDRVLLLLLDSPAFVAAFWGAIKLGAIPIPTNTLLTSDDYEFMLRDSGARGLVVQDSLVEKVAPALARLSDLKTVWVVGAARSGYESFEAALAQSAPTAAAAPTHRDAPAFWLYTSGSTGRPKAAIHLHHDMVYCLETFAKHVLQISARDRTFSASKLFFAYGLGNALYFPFGVGGSTVLLAERPSAEKIFEVIRRTRPTLFFAVPTLYAAMLQIPEAETADLGSVRLAVSAGEALPAPLYERFRERFGLSIIDGIGSTEMLHMFISNRPGDITSGSSGKLVPGYDARIVDEHGNDLPAGEIGNLWIRGDSAAAGYWNRPELTRATFCGGWSVTGDKYIRDAHGVFWYCGRSDDMLKVSGLWVSPLEIETALLAHPAVVECAVVGATSSDGLTKPKAFVVLKEAMSVSGQFDAELREFLRSRLPAYKVPEWIVLADSLPKTATGKIQRFKLRQQSIPPA
ncbi:MAG: benzoate-CoA ligase family protein [Terriglobia bacterium]